MFSVFLTTKASDFRSNVMDLIKYTDKQQMPYPFRSYLHHKCLDIHTCSFRSQYPHKFHHFGKDLDHMRQMTSSILQKKPSISPVIVSASICM